MQGESDASSPVESEFEPSWALGLEVPEFMEVL